MKEEHFDTLAAPAMKLLLLDVDGTLLRTKAGRAAMETTLQQVYGIDDGLVGIEMQGCTDASIIASALARHGLPLPRDLSEFWSVNVRVLDDLLSSGKSPVDILPGVRDLLAAASTREDVQLGLVTGNARGIAEVKLSRLGLWEHFPIGAFGCEDPIRWKLVDLARRRAQKRWSLPYEDDDVVVIGDTHRDVAAARQAGVLACAVATGHCDSATLALCRPDLLLATLEGGAATLDRLTLMGRSAATGPS